MLVTLLTIACVLYAAEYLFFFAGVLRSGRIPRVVGGELPSVTIIVAARNEVANIERCLTALLNQDFPADRMQILAANDDSEDDTLAVMERVSARSPGRIKVVTTVHEDSHAMGKARAIAQAMDHAAGEIILLTDADCIPPTTWARSAVEHFVPGVDAYGGFTVIESRDVFSAVQQLDWVHLQTLASAALAFNVPIGVIGNNFGFRRSAYDEVGGYRRVGFSVTEDFALFKAIHRRGRKVVFPSTSDSYMVTNPCPTIADVLRQKQRWARGGTETGPRGYAVLVIAVLMMVAMPIAPFVGAAAWLGVWSTKFAFDLLVMYPNLKRLGRAHQLRYFLLFEFYFIAQAFVIPILLMNRNVVWKGRTYRA